MISKRGCHIERYERLTSIFMCNPFYTPYPVARFRVKLDDFNFIITINGLIRNAQSRTPQSRLSVTHTRPASSTSTD